MQIPPTLYIITFGGDTMTNNIKTKEDILKIIDNEHLEFLRFLYTDNDSIIRGYCSAKEFVAGDLDSGMAFAKVMPVFSTLDVIVPGSSLSCTGELRCVPDLSTFSVLPYAEKQGVVICDFKTIDHEESELCSRTVLKNVLRNSPYRVSASFENEYYYAFKNDDGSYSPFDRSLCFATPGMQATEKIILETVAALDKQGIRVEKYYPELGPGQQELVIRYADALRAADNQILLRETVRAVAAKHGVIATFMPKPFQGCAGSGCHLHVSLWNDNVNLFYDRNGKHTLSDTALYFIGGILDHIAPLCAFTASTVSSYKRLVPQNWASAYTCYGLDNREAAVRICSGQKGNEAKSTNLEFKPTDGACNPYLALAALLSAGFDGIKRKLDPGDAVMIDPYEYSEQERKAQNIERLPSNLNEAIIALENDQFFSEQLGETIVREYIALKKYQWHEYHNQITTWEANSYFEAF
jgi:glutamine synthetase